MNFSSPIRRRTASAALLALAAGRVLASCQRYCLASTAYAQSRADVLNRAFLALQKAGQWVKSRPREAATLLSTAWGLDAATIEQAKQPAQLPGARGGACGAAGAATHCRYLLRRKAVAEKNQRAGRGAVSAGSLR